ncbi:MAG: hypothetical protein H6687_00035 [Bacillales bacterium]|nr:hypothetical protein [Bacillales bacterium]
MVERKKLPHALIFYGDKSTSKKEMAFYLAKLIYAKIEDSSIEECEAAKRIDDNSHPNVFYIEPLGLTIRKEQITSILSEAAKTALEEGPKIFIFDQADNLNPSSSNSLLKFIEEPQDDIHIIFLVDNLSSILDTIKSRCALYSFRPLNKDFLKERLDLEGISESLSSILMEYSQNEDLILSLAKTEEYLKIVDFVPALFMKKFETNESVIIFFNDNYKLIDTMEKQDFFLSLFTFYLKDILNYVEFKNENFIYKAEKGRIKELGNISNELALGRLMREILELKTKIKYNVNLRLNLDCILLELEDAYRK